MAQDKIFAGIGGNTSIFTFDDKLYIQDNLDIFINGGTLEASPDSPIASTFGKLKFGWVGINADWWYLSHFDQFSDTNYALKSSATGQLVLNTPTGENMYFANNNVVKMTLDQNGNLSQRPDEDATDTFGRGKLGYNGSNSDQFALAHYDHMSSTNYMIKHTADGRVDINAASGQDIYFRINDVTKMILDANGDLGIGAVPATDLYVYRSSGTVQVQANSASLASGESTSINAVGTGGALGARVGGIGVVYYDQSGSGGSNAACGYLQLREGDGTQQYFWVDNSGNFRISSTDSHRGSTNGTVVGTQTSDIRVKNILSNCEYGLNEILQINPIKYSYKNDQQQVKHIGFSAQEIINIIPEAVYDTNEKIEGFEDTKLAMDYTEIIPVLVNAMKEQQIQISDLKTELNILKGIK